jgi:hypothetical protein
MVAVQVVQACSVQYQEQPQISFGWDFMNSASYQLALRVNDTYVNHLCTATNCQALNFTPWIGSPINVGLAAADFANKCMVLR